MVPPAQSSGIRAQPRRFWLLTGIALLLALIIVANGHFLFVAFTSQPGCMEETSLSKVDGSVQRLKPARESC